MNSFHIVTDILYLYILLYSEEIWKRVKIEEEIKSLETSMPSRN